MPPVSVAAVGSVAGRPRLWGTRAGGGGGGVPDNAMTWGGEVMTWGGDTMTWTN